MAEQRRQGGRRGTRRETRERDEFRDPVVVKINRCAAVVKGGRRFSFSALVVVGDGKGRVGIGFGKAKEVAGAVEKGTKEAKQNVVRVSVVGGTIPHGILGAFGASRIKMRPAQKGRGVIACAAVRAVVESAGIKDVVTKSLGSNNPLNLVKATLRGLQSGRTREQVEALRGVKLS
jgi:small subunit ribosomal protein S5